MYSGDIVLDNIRITNLFFRSADNWRGLIKDCFCPGCVDPGSGFVEMALKREFP